jgi:hypothetical protein
MRYGLVFPNFGTYSNLRLLTELAETAEEAGWHGFFLADTIQMVGYETEPVADPWIALAAIAQRTSRIRLGPRVAALSRRRPWQLAREAVTLDHLSGGRLILGAGAGDELDRAFTDLDEERDARRRAAMLDESLDIITGLWRGQPFRFQGEHYRLDTHPFLPRPVQSPRIPIWVGWRWPRQRPLARVARWDGANPFLLTETGEYGEITPEDTRTLKRYLEEHRSSNAPYDIVIDGPVLDATTGDPEAAELLRAHEAAGATWALEFIVPERDPNEVRQIIRQGTPSRTTALTPAPA